MRSPLVTPDGRESVQFITTEFGEDIIIGYAIATAEPGEVVSLILQRHPPFEVLLPADERGVSVSHESFLENERELAKRITVDGLHVDIETTVRVYQIDLAHVDQRERDRARKALRRMHRYGGFTLELR